MEYQVTKGKNYWEVEIKFMRIFFITSNTTEAVFSVCFSKKKTTWGVQWISSI